MKRGFWIAAILCAAMGACFVFGYTPMRVSGYLLFAAAAGLLCLGLLPVRRAGGPGDLLGQDGQ